MQRIFKMTATPCVAILTASLLLAPSLANAAGNVTRSFCVYDPIGANGFMYQAFQPYVVQALNWGVKLNPKAYTDEKVAMADFNAGKCDALEVLGINNIHIEKFAGSLDMLGGLKSYQELHTAIQVLSSPKAAKYMVQGNVETVGIVPAGKVFLFARNRADLRDLNQDTGKKVAILDGDQQAIEYADVFGASSVNATLASFGPMFNNGSVDLAYAPSFAYKALELYKGMQPNGGVARYVLGILTSQIDIHKNRFPSGYGQKSRQWVLQHMWRANLRRIKATDASIPDKYWYDINAEQRKQYNQLTVKTRVRLWKQNWYSHKMQTLLKKIRCRDKPAMAECSQNTEGGPVS